MAEKSRFSYKEDVWIVTILITDQFRINESRPKCSNDTELQSKSAVSINSAPAQTFHDYLCFHRNGIMWKSKKGWRKRITQLLQKTTCVEKLKHGEDMAHQKTRITGVNVLIWFMWSQWGNGKLYFHPLLFPKQKGNWKTHESLHESYSSNKMLKWRPRGEATLLPITF